MNVSCSRQVDYDMDTSAQYRKSEPTLYGMIPTRNKGHRHAKLRATSIFLGDMLARSSGRLSGYRYRYQRCSILTAACI